MRNIFLVIAIKRAFACTFDIFNCIAITKIKWFHIDWDIGKQNRGFVRINKVPPNMRHFKLMSITWFDKGCFSLHPTKAIRRSFQGGGGGGCGCSSHTRKTWEIEIHPSISDPVQPAEVPLHRLLPQRG